MKIIGCALLALATTAAAAPPPDLARAFARIDARTETGVNYRDLSQLVGDANLELKMYAATPDAARHKEGLDLLAASVTVYSESVSLWGLKIKGAATSFYSTAPIFQGYAKRYPKAVLPAENGGAMIGEGMHIDYLLPFLWRDAADLAHRGLAQL